MYFHQTIFDYLEPTEHQKDLMTQVRRSVKTFADDLDRIVPEGTDKVHIVRSLRTLAMWANVAITRHADGTPRTKDNP